MLDLDAIEARAEAATPGPWIGSSVPSGRKYGVISVKDYGEWTRSGGRPLAVLLGIPTHGRHPDTQFIAHARTDVPALVAELRAAREVVKAAQQRRAKGAPDHPIWRDFDAALAAYRAVVGEV